MDAKTVKKYYIIAGIFFSLAVIIGILRLVDLFFLDHILQFLDLYAIILLVLSLFVIITMVIHANCIDKKKAIEAEKRAKDPEKLQKYVSKKNK